LPLVVMRRNVLAVSTIARHIWYVEMLLRSDAQIGGGNVVDGLIAFAVRRTIVVDQIVAVKLLLLLLLLLTHEGMHVLIQVIMVEMMIMVTERSIRSSTGSSSSRNVCRR